jgi:hypothetical protein
LSMRIRNLQRGGGQALTAEFSRWDTFEPADGPHSSCQGRSVVLGLGLDLPPFGVSVPLNETPEGLLLRCLVCYTSYVVA